MSVFNAENNARILNGMHSYAREVIIPQRFSTMFSRCPLITYLTGRNKGPNTLGRPGTAGLVGGDGIWGRVQREKEVAGTGVQVRWQFQTTGGLKKMGQRDTMPSTGNTSQDQNNKSALFRRADFVQPIKVWNSTLRAARGAERIADAVKEATEEAFDVMTDALNDSLWRGLPSDQSADIWDDALGLIHALNTANTYGNVDRSQSANARWRGLRSTTGQSASLGLIDKMNVTDGAADKGPGIDFILTSKEIYLALKAEALAKGQSIVVGNMPEAAKVGITMECIKYGNVTITYDPFLTNANWASWDSAITDASKVMVGFTSEDWVFSTATDGNWNVSPFVDQSDRSGGEDAVQAFLRVSPMLRCNKPERSIIYTNVSVGS